MDAALIALREARFWQAVGTCKAIPRIASVCREWRAAVTPVSEVVRMICPLARFDKPTLHRMLDTGKAALSRHKSPVLLYVAVAIAENKQGGLAHAMIMREAKARMHAMAREEYKESLDRFLRRKGISPGGEYYEHVLLHPGSFSKYRFQLEHMIRTDYRFESITNNLKIKWPEWTEDKVHKRAREIFERLVTK